MQIRFLVTTNADHGECRFLSSLTRLYLNKTCRIVSPTGGLSIRHHDYPVQSHAFHFQPAAEKFLPKMFRPLFCQCVVSSTVFTGVPNTMDISEAERFLHEPIPRPNSGTRSVILAPGVLR